MSAKILLYKSETNSEEIEKSNKNFKIFKNMIHQNELVTASESGESISESGDSLI